MRAIALLALTGIACAGADSVAPSPPVATAPAEVSATTPALTAPAEISAVAPSATPPTTLSIDPRVAAADLLLQEEVLLRLVEELAALKADLVAGRIAGAHSEPLFAEELAVLGVASVGEAHLDPDLPPHLGVHRVPVPLDPHPQTQPRSAAAPLGPLLRGFDRLDLVALHVPEGRFLDPASTRFRTGIDLELRGMASGSLRYARIHADLDWQLGPVPEVPAGERPLPGRWTVAAWTTRSVAAQQAPGPLFREVLDSLVPDPAQRARARRSLHEELVVERTEHPTASPPPPFYDPASHDRHPGVAVADVNGDGLDDIYVTARLGRNQLLLAQPDGTFVEAAARFGLDIDGHTAAPLFVDLDNDGDLDAFLGRTLEPSLLLIQGPDGRFVSRPDAAATPLPRFVSSVSAADVNRDGLLDLYVSTYALHAGFGLGEGGPPLDPAEEQRLLREHDVILNAHGPANQLLLNQGGGRLARSDASPTIWRHTYQATFADWDADGNPDLYVVNDYAENVALRNRGDGTFEDVTAALGVGDIGFGMGASFGDVDQDGRQDLYVSNMFSNAGRRATSALPGLDPKLAKMARGNTLFRNVGERFEVVSGVAPPALEVEVTGWSWGGRFVDVDNDGAEDIAVLNGYFTAPSRVALPVDI